MVQASRFGGRRLMGLVDAHEPSYRLQGTRGFVKLNKSSALIFYFTRDAVLDCPCVIVRGHDSEGPCQYRLPIAILISLKWMERPKLLPCLGDPFCLNSSLVGSICIPEATGNV